MLKKGYTVEELLNLPRIKSLPSLTSVDDLDYKIMSHLSINDLRTLSYINHYTYDQLHKDELLWINKLKEEGLYESIPDIDLTNINWLKLYKTLKTIKKVIDDIKDGDRIKYTINEKYIKYFDKLASDLNIPVRMHPRYPEFKIGYIRFGMHSPRANNIDKYIGYYITSAINDKDIHITHNQLVTLLFDLYYNNIILKIKQT